MHYVAIEAASSQLALYCSSTFAALPCAAPPASAVPLQAVLPVGAAAYVAAEAGDARTALQLASSTAALPGGAGASASHSTAISASQTSTLGKLRPLVDDVVATVVGCAAAAAAATAKVQRSSLREGAGNLCPLEEPRGQ
eukprot:6935-Heterococcus_DN1.PRE.1